MIKIEHRKSFFFIMVVLFNIYCTADSEAVDENIIQWNISNMFLHDSGISVLRYGALGLGAYPYECSLPGNSLRVNVDGVPMRSISPFGPDLELVSSKWVDSLEYHGFRELNITTKDIDVKEPMTDTSFLVGTKHRFNFDMTFERMLSEKTGIFISGSSNGIHGCSDTEKNSLRNYFVKYQRFLENGATINFLMRAFRDRDGLVDINSDKHMGERKTDNFTTSIGIKEYPLGEMTTVSPVFYYQSSLSRFHRYGLRKSLDDDAAGLNVSLTSKRGNTLYSIYALHDIRFFDSRIHDEQWTRQESEITASFTHENDNHRLILDGGLMNSSKYGAGIKVEGEITLFDVFKQELVLSGIITNEFPDTDKEYYSSLVFNDTSIISKVRKYNISELEGGMRFKRSLLNLGLYIFGSSSQLPLFRVSSGVTGVSEQYQDTTHFVMSSRKQTLGYRINFNVHVEKSYQLDFKFNYNSRLKGVLNNTQENWPYPSSEFFSDLRISGKFFKEHLASTVFGNARNWSPYGNYFLFDCGMLIKVSNLELFYKIENIMNKNIQLYETMGWLGRNAMWGGKWIFYN